MTNLGGAERTTRWGYGSIGAVRYGMVVVCVIAQAATLAITWPLWQLRDAPPHLPAIDLPQVPFGWLLVGSLLVVLIRPRLGLPLHVAILLSSFVFDQFRIQPQVIGIAVMMMATVEPQASDFGRWYLISMWFWAGFHKLVSPDWTGQVAWNLLSPFGLNREAWHSPLAYAAAIGEILLGLLALVRPRWAAYGCVLLHVGIAVLLSPWVHDWNYSVIPWNLCTAAVGFWLMWTSPGLLPRTPVQYGVAALLMILPAGFYLGWVDDTAAQLLYSDNVPLGLITRDDGLTQIGAWGEDWVDLRVPFPCTRRLLRQYFDLTAKPGWKLHLTDPRPWLDDAYYLKQADGATIEIGRDRFLSATTDEVAGIERDDARSLFALSRAGARMLKRSADSMIYAVEIPPAHYQATLLDVLHGLPNLEQLQLGGCHVVDADLRRLVGCDKLSGLGLDDTDVTDDGISYLVKLPKLHHIELRNTKTSAATRQLFHDESQ